MSLVCLSDGLLGVVPGAGVRMGRGWLQSIGAMPSGSSGEGCKAGNLSEFGLGVS